MGDKTKIAWADATWNPITGCSKVSPGCKNCYAETLTERFGGDFSKIVLHRDRLEQPLKWKKPRRIFVNSMSDLFHKDVPASFIIDCFEVIVACPQHEFLTLTKRPERVESVLYGIEGHHYLGGGDWYPNIMVGFSAEDQQSFNSRWRYFTKRRIGERIEWAYAMRLWCSIEPLLGPIKLPWTVFSGGAHLEWIVIGGESGPHYRPCEVSWIADIVDQCRAAGVACYVKQDSHRLPGQQGRIPDALWSIKEFPGEEKTVER